MPSHAAVYGSLCLWYSSFIKVACYPGGWEGGRGRLTLCSPSAAHASCDSTRPRRVLTHRPRTAPARPAHEISSGAAPRLAGDAPLGCCPSRPATERRASSRSLAMSPRVRASALAAGATLEPPAWHASASAARGIASARPSQHPTRRPHAAWPATTPVRPLACSPTRRRPANNLFGIPPPTAGAHASVRGPRLPPHPSYPLRPGAGLPWSGPTVEGRLGHACGEPMRIKPHQTV